MPSANVDLVTNTGGGLAGSGLVAARLMQGGFNINSLRTNDVLRKDEWIAFDNVIVEVARQRLIGVGDLMSRGLTHDVPNALGKTRVEWERIGDMNPAEVSMSGVTPGQSDRLTFDLEGVPLPIIHKDFNINIRALEASRNGGSPLDTTQAALAGKLVSEKIEDILFNGYDLTMQGSGIYGYTTHGSRNTGTASDWGNYPTVDGADMLADVIEIINDLYAQKMYGPFVFYIPLEWYVNLGNDFKAESDKTILQRLKEVPGVADIKPSEQLTDEIVTVQMTRDVVDMINGIQPTVVMWESHGGMVFNFKVMAIMVPRLKSTKTGQMGLAHYTV